MVKLRVAAVRAAAVCLVLMCAGLFSGPAQAQPALERIPSISAGSQRPITLDDVARLRSIDSVAVSPDGRRFSVLVRQGDVAANAYVGSWFVGDTDTGAMRFAGDAGAIRYDIMASGHIVGEVHGRNSTWSPDGAWFAYLREQDGAVQVWASRAADGRQRRLSFNAADALSLAWSEDGRLLFYAVGDTRAAVRSQADARYRGGYAYDTDIFSFSDFLLPQMRPAPSSSNTIWAIDVARGRERPASAEESASYPRLLAPEVKNAAGARALVRSGEGPFAMQIAAAPADSGAELACEAAACRGMILGRWWSADGARVYFWRREGVNYMGHGFYAWTPGADHVDTIARLSDDDLRLCQLAAEERIVCARETPTMPAHLVSVNVETRALSLLADVNPEFRNIRLGAVQRFEWDTPRFDWQAPGGPLANVYPARAYGYILYPPDYDPSRSYPVFIDPYVANGFNRGGSEHALHVYAANGFIVLDLAFPVANSTGFHGDFMQYLYDAEEGYPHLSMLASSTEAGLDAAIALAPSIDRTRVGVGGYSHGTFVPLYWMMHRDRVSAISISSATWGPHEYYSGSRASARAARAVLGDDYRDWRPDPATPAGRAFWSGFDVADHVDQLEAPVLVNVSAEETYALARLLRYMSDAHHPYDAYIFADETHIKWQPAHLAAIRARNLDWFRFWLQDIADPAPTKAEQYERWRQLRMLQCENPRAVRNLCAVESTHASPMR